MVNITVDGMLVEAEEDELLISACERNGVHIPRFCYHPRMESVGMCRVCLVEVDTGRGATLQPSCVIAVAENMQVHTDSEATKKAQDGVLEFLLVNHPLDCPICDKGGECPLQDQTMAYGPGETRFVEKKRNFEKPIPISSTVYLDRERCILCDRCTRFADQVAGDPLIHFMGRGALSEINIFPDEPFSSYFSGNTVQICPVGALTALPYRFKARPWDLSDTLSTAWVDSMGARVNVQASHNRVLRLLGEDSEAVNWGWLSDKERFAFEALNHESRLRSPLIRNKASPITTVNDTDTETDETDTCTETHETDNLSDYGSAGNEADHDTPTADDFVETTWDEALSRTVDALAAAHPKRIAVLGGARLTNEAQYAWIKLIKGFLGCDNVDAQLNDGIKANLLLNLPRATISDTCRPDSTVILLGPDPKEELGSLYLRLRHAIMRDNVSLIEIQPCAGGLTSIAAHTLQPQPGETAVLVRSLVHAANYARSTRKAGIADIDAYLNKKTPGVGKKNKKNPTPKIAATSSNKGKAVRTANALEADVEIAGVASTEIAAAAKTLSLASEGVTIILGRPSLAESVQAIEEGLLELRKLPSVRFLSALRRGNIHGALNTGFAPAWLPGHTHQKATKKNPAVRSRFKEFWPKLPNNIGFDAQGILAAAARHEIDVLILLGADPLNDFTDRRMAHEGLQGASMVVAVDMFLNDSSSAAADVVLAAAGPTESEGTFTNLENRVTLMGHKVTPLGTSRPDWTIAAELAFRLNPEQDFNSDSPQAIRAELARVSDMHSMLTEEALNASPIEGVLLTKTGNPPKTADPSNGAGPSEVADPDKTASATTTATSVSSFTTTGFSAKQAAVKLSATPGISLPPPATRDSRSQTADLSKLADTASSLASDSGNLSASTDTSQIKKSAGYVNLKLVAIRTMYDDGVMLRHCPSSSKSVQPASARINPKALSRLGIANAAEVKITSDSGSINAKLYADNGVPEGSLVLPWLSPGAPANTLIAANELSTTVKVEPLASPSSGVATSP
ncbi:MAG: molybdopterin-dependent oxidoreductase [Acidimicrobiaceae bacterium]|nr:molybdopterin-dependent oxidoreductase [Acidimicrobiaceae bacterium]